MNTIVGGIDTSFSTKLNENFIEASQFRVGVHLPAFSAAISSTTYTVASELILTDYNCFAVDVFYIGIAKGTAGSFIGYVKATLTLSDDTVIEILPEINSVNIETNYNIFRF
jgi:hypothetical protein